VKKILMTVDGMHCAGCVSAVRSAITDLDPDAEVEISIADRHVVAETQATTEQIVDAITRLGYEVEAARTA